MRASGVQSVVDGGREAWIAGALCVAYVATLSATLALGAGGIPPFWMSNACIAGLVILVTDRRRLALALGFCALCSIPLLINGAKRVDLGLVRVVLNLIEGGMAGWLAVHALGPRRLLRSASGFLRLQVLAVLPAALINFLLREASLRLLTDPHEAQTWRAAFLPHYLGLAVILPALLLLFQPAMRELRRSRVETVVLVGGVALIAHLIFNVARAPMAFVISPMLMMLAFRLGPRGSVFGHVAVALICLPATLNGGGVFQVVPGWDLHMRALVYQSMLLSSEIGLSFCAFVVADQARLRRLLTLRAASARESRRRALIASRAKTDFLATMSHEIRTTMNSILGFTQLLMHNPGVSEDAREQIQVIADAGGSLMTVLNDILDFSKVEAGQIELHVEPLNMAALAESAVQIMGEAAAAKGLGLTLELEGLDGRYLGDGQRLRQVLLNLLNNAVKFTDEGHVLLQARRVSERGAIRFEISDTGIGIDEAVVGRLFARFSQADTSTTRHYGGSGLGLAICRGLVERMGGAIGVESRIGLGSTFWFEIPAAATDRPALPVQSPGQTRRVGGRVLLVDDHAMNRRLGETLLRLLGCEVDVVASGEEAVQAARTQAYDAILMDVHMPRMDGLSAAHAIRTLDGPSNGAPIIAMSADVMPLNVERCRQAGMVDHLAKPVQLETLQAVLERWTIKHRRRSAA